MTVAELEAKIKLYHTTLVEEREVKSQLIEKLEAVRDAITRYVSQKSGSSKAAGIPFNSNFMGAFISQDGGLADRSQNFRAEEALAVIQKIVF